MGVLRTCLFCLKKTKQKHTLETERGEVKRKKAMGAGGLEERVRKRDTDTTGDILQRRSGTVLISLLPLTSCGIPLKNLDLVSLLYFKPKKVRLRKVYINVYFKRPSM